jgi:hypothetical protein
MEEQVRRQSVSRRTLLSGTAGLLGGAVLSPGAVLAQNTGPASTGAAPTSSYNPHYPDPAWLALRQEEIIEPELEIVDPHHHLWDRPGNRFLLDQLLADMDSGHKITETVFIECGSMYRAEGPVEMKPVGETEFVNGTAAMSASGQYGPTLPSDCRTCRFTAWRRGRTGSGSPNRGRRRPLSRHSAFCRLGRERRVPEAAH